MKVELPDNNNIKDIFVAIVLENDDPESPDWQAYFINDKDADVQNVLISSKGYGELDGKSVQTSVLRHFIGDVPAHDFARIEPVDPQVFALSNEYWVSFYYDGVLYDKKMVFAPNSIQAETAKFVKIGDVEKKGFRIGEASK